MGSRRADDQSAGSHSADPDSQEDEGAGAALPVQHAEEPDEAIAEALRLLNVPTALVTSFLHRELMSVFGWAAHAAFEDWQDPTQPTLRQILAIRKLAHILHPEAFPDPPGTIPWELGRITP